jgi:GT2 family glycosyltransferase
MLVDRTQARLLHRRRRTTTIMQTSINNKLHSSAGAVVNIGAIVVNYNAGPRLLECVRALLGEAELDRIWVVDNRSTDDSLSEIDALAAVGARISVIRNESNIGFGAANNLVLRGFPQTDWLLVNPDCLLKPNAVQNLLACRRAHPRSGLLGGLVRNPDGSEQRGCRRDLPKIGTSLARTLGLQRWFGRRRWTNFDHTGLALPAEPVRVQAVSGALMYLRADALRETGGFDEGYFLHCEDLDICKRMADAGWEVWFVPDAEAVHFQGTSSRRLPLRVHWHKHRGIWRYYRKFEAPAHNSLFNLVVFAGIWIRFCVTATGAWLRALIAPRRAQQ